MIGRRVVGRSKVMRLLPGRPPVLPGALAMLLMFLAVLTLAAAVAADRAAKGWGEAIADSATLSVIAEEAEIEAQARAALSILRETPGVREVRVMDPAEQRALLAPFLGTGIAFDAASLPLMIAVESDRNVLDAAALDLRLAAEAPGVVFEDHSAWRLPLAMAAARQRNLAVIATGLLGMALAMGTALGVRIDTASVGESVRTLKEIGMSDVDLRRMFLARIGGVLATGIGIGTTVGLIIVGGSDSDQTTTGLAIGFAGWAWALPPFTAGLGLLLGLGAAWIAADRALRAWP